MNPFRKALARLNEAVFGLHEGGFVRDGREEVLIPVVQHGAPEIIHGYRVPGGSMVTGCIVSVETDLSWFGGRFTGQLLEHEDLPFDWKAKTMPLVLASDAIDAMTKLRLAKR